MYYLTDFNGTTIVPSLQMIHSLSLEELSVFFNLCDSQSVFFSISVFLNLCDSQSVLFSISVFLNLCDSQLVFFSICAFLNQCFSQLVLFSISAIWGRHPMLYFNIPRTKKCSIAMCYFLRILLTVDTMFDAYLDSATYNLQVFEGGYNFFSANQSLITSSVSSSNLGLCMSKVFFILVQLYLPLSRGSYSRLTF